ncbi:MAG: Fe(2+) transporter permease subunit FeoB [Legionellaceae bacterium]|nr:Fe(2+) transporter permease subunit FeoB [Legionellaceae bacterium]
MMHIVLVGNPNCGKTTLFNSLTGEHQRVGNWPGVTVEQKTGSLKLANSRHQLTDLPGVYSMVSLGQTAGLDEQIAAKAILELDYDVMINVVDACHLERHLYLTTQLIELGKPLILALNMSDRAAQQGIQIDSDRLAKTLGCPVLPIQAHKEIGLVSLQAELLKVATLTAGEGASVPAPSTVLQLPSDLASVYPQIRHYFEARNETAAHAFYLSQRALEGDYARLDDTTLQAQLTELESDILAADARYHAIHGLVAAVQSRDSDASEHFTARLDRLVLHRFLAIPLFLGIMYLMFLFAINIGGAFQDFFDISSEALFVQGPAWLLSQSHAPHWLIAIVANGLGKGINTTLTFIPVIAAMFFFLALLEASGYMARAAFVVDRLMRWLGLPGKSFVPMIVGFGCNVPAIMAARALDNERDRLLTVLMSPFMSCSARLAIYAVFVAAFFPTGGQNVVFSLYLMGILMAVLTGLMLRRTRLAGHASPLILELPAYHRPSFARLARDTLRRLRYFLIRAGRFIIPVCIVLGGLNSLTISGGLQQGDASAQSLLAWVGQSLTPLFSPMGLHSENWPATVGLLSGMLAKEVVVGTLNSLYAQMGQAHLVQLASFDLWASLTEALYSIPANLAHLGQALLNPVYASAKHHALSQSVYGVMAQQFDGKAGAYAYLLFVLLYIPCVSTMAAIRQEASQRWMWFSVSWSLLLAYAVAVIFYQFARFSLHPLSSMAWAAVMVLAIGVFIWRLSAAEHQSGAGGEYAAANP